MAIKDWGFRGGDFFNTMVINKLLANPHTGIGLNTRETSAITTDITPNTRKLAVFTTGDRGDARKTLDFITGLNGLAGVIWRIGSLVH